MPDNKEALVQILTYHVIAGKVDSKSIVDMSSADTVEGSSVMIETEGNEVMLNSNTKVIKADIPASNGIIHCIDSVLMPADLDLTGLA